jgi:hypothetical protein
MSSTTPGMNSIADVGRPAQPVREWGVQGNGGQTGGQLTCQATIADLRSGGAGCTKGTDHDHQSGWMAAE